MHIKLIVPFKRTVYLSLFHGIIVFFEHSQCAEYATDIFGKRDSSSAVEGRITIKQFGNGTDAVVEEFFFEAYKLSFYVIYSTHFVYSEVCFKVKAGESWPGCTLMICQVSLVCLLYTSDAADDDGYV